MKKTIGFVGIGKMGEPMVNNLINTGFEVVVHDVISERMDLVVKAGARKAISANDVANQSETIILSLPNMPILEQVIRGQAGILSAEIDGKVIIDTTTATEKAAKEIYDCLKERNASFLDAPVTGGVYGAQKGTLRFFVGGDKEVFDTQQDVFNAMGKGDWIGPAGHGQIGKMICQMIGSANILIAIEAAGFAMHLGADIEKINAVLSNNGRGPMSRVIECLRTNDFNDEGYLTQRSKDIDYCLDAAARSHTFLPLTAAMQQMFNIARMSGLGDMDNEAIIKLYQEWIDKS